MADRNRKIIKFHKGSQFNIGVIIFLIILVYMLYNIFQYFTTERVAVYEISQGTIAQNNTFTGVILREEKIYNTDASGYITYYNRDATKVGVNSYVYSVDETGHFYQDMLEVNQSQYQVRIACSEWHIVSFICQEISAEEWDRARWEEGKDSGRICPELFG